MELVQGFIRGQEIKQTMPVGGLAGWMTGALRGRVRIKWRTGTQRRMKQMQILEALSLGEKRQVVLIVCNGERYLVGCGANTVATITKLNSAIETLPNVKIAAQT